MAFGFEAPLTADARMQDLLQRTFFSRVGEHYGADRLPVQPPTLQINSAKLLLDRSPHLRVAIRQLPRRNVRIEKSRLGNELAQALDEACLPGPYPPRDTDGWHVLVACRGARCSDGALPPWKRLSVSYASYAN
jgi:hypothetical protein